jgi:hypothetical protein
MHTMTIQEMGSEFEQIIDSTGLERYEITKFKAKRTEPTTTLETNLNPLPHLQLFRREEFVLMHLIAQ